MVKRGFSLFRKPFTNDKKTRNHFVKGFLILYNKSRGETMLLQEKMKETKFSPSEKIVVEFILEKQEQIQSYSTIMIAGETYTSPSILIRIAKKLGFKGFNDFKDAFLKEVLYLQTNFQNLDANIPFTSQDNIMNITHKIAQLKIESLHDSLSLIHHDHLQKAVRIMQKSRTVKVFTISNLTFLAEEFVHKMRHIGKSAETYPISNSLYQEALMMKKDECAICISYSGQSSEIIQTGQLLHQNHIPIITLTSIGENHLTQLSDVVLNISTRERSYSKIAGFSSLESISFLLDILYSCYFASDYQKHFQYKLKIAKATEHRTIDNHILKNKNIDF